MYHRDLFLASFGTVQIGENKYLKKVTLTDVWKPNLKLQFLTLFDTVYGGLINSLSSFLFLKCVHALFLNIEVKYEQLWIIDLLSQYNRITFYL